MSASRGSAGPKPASGGGSAGPKPASDAAGASGPWGAFRTVRRTGVIYVTTEAAKRGFTTTDPTWCNLGQGQPESGELAGAPPRVHTIPIAVDDQEYAPIAG